MKKMYLTVWIVMAVLILNIIPAYADDINIIGELKDRLTLTIDNEYIFNRDNIVPGEEWSANITLQNSSKEDISVSLLDINSDNDAVSDCLNLTVLGDDTVLYEGDYIHENTPYFTVTVKGLSSMRIVANVNVVLSAGNHLQNESLHSVWEFEAKTVKDIQPTVVPQSATWSNPRRGSGSMGIHSSGIIARIFSTDDNTVQQSVGNNNNAEDISIEPEPYEINSRAEISEKERATEKASNNAASEDVSLKLDTAKNENSKQKDKTNVKQKNKPVKTGNEHMNDTTTDITNILMLLLSFITITYIIISWRRRNKNG